MSNTNTRTKPSFAQTIQVQLIAAAIGFLTLLLISLSYIALRTVDFTDVKMTILEAESFIQRLDSNPKTELPTDQNMTAYRNWNNIPSHLKKPFEGQNLTFGELTETTFTNLHGEEAYIALLPMLRKNGEAIYFISEYNFDQSNDVYEEIFDQFLVELIWLLAFIFSFLFIFVAWLLKRAAEPLSLLSKWSQGLKTEEGLKDTEFAIAEVDELAKQLKDGVDKLTAFNEREKQFLKYASHELRTPQTIVQACLDTLQLQLDGAKLKTVERALRANVSMSRLSTALLWLSKENPDPLEKSNVSLLAMSEELIAENNHLIASKGLKVIVNAQIDNMCIERDLLLIVFSNLLKNACQHTEQGEITLTLAADGLTVSNYLGQVTSSNDLENFGLGLQLVNSICDKLNWQFRYSEHDNRVTTTLAWQGAPSK